MQQEIHCIEWADSDGSSEAKEGTYGLSSVAKEDAVMSTSGLQPKKRNMRHLEENWSEEKETESEEGEKL